MSKKHASYYKKIPLIPTEFHLDVFVSEDGDLICKDLSEKIGETPDYWKDYCFDDNGSHTSAMVVDHEARDGTWSIIMLLRNFEEPSVIAHESVHVTWSLDKRVGLNFRHKSQETQSYYVGYIMDEILKMKECTVKEMKKTT